MFSRLAATIVALSSLLQYATAIKPARQPQQPTGNGEKLLTFNDTVIEPVFTVDTLSIEWISGDEDGLAVILSDAGAITLENYATGESSTLVPADQVPSDYQEYWIRGDLEKVMFSTDYVKQYRYSYFANYVIFDVETGETTPLTEEQSGDVQYAAFAPMGDLVAFVRGNDLFVKDLADGSVEQITNDGGPDMFHGVPDWVYEEEILGDRYAFWFAPDASFLALMSFNETGVGTFTIPYYMNDSEVAPV